MSAFITAICNGNFVMDDVINADLLFLYDNELEEGLVREKEKKYFEMIVNFNQWKPNSTSQHPVLSEDLLRIPVSLDITHIRSFAYHVYIQTMARVNNDNTSFNTNVMNEIDQDIIKAYKVFQNEKLVWTLGDCQAFLKTRMEYHKSLPTDAVSEKNIKFFEFLLHVTSGVLNFDVFWFYHVPPGSGSLDDAILDEMFIQHLFHQFA
ncbi:Protein CBG16874 [Caenorhabditis briggsae]|nr:Protein CBG16874 [Caenorhabditis briggsae]CAP34722.1 Protein CBG16874 [Caenorhabditis briggsae]